MRIIAFALLSSVLFACGSGSPPPATEPKPGDLMGDSAAGASGSMTGSASSTSMDSSSSSADGTSSSSSTPGPATSANSRPLESALKPKVTSAGGTYAVGTVTSKGLTQEDVVRTAGAASDKTDACYEKVFKKHLGTTGKTSFDISIDAKGKTQSVKLTLDELKDADLVKCLQGVLHKLEWPKPTQKTGAKVSLEWVVAGN